MWPMGLASVVERILRFFGADGLLMFVLL